MIYTGQEATQQIIAGLIGWVKEKGAKSLPPLGSDYIWPRTLNKIARSTLRNRVESRRREIPAWPYPVQLGH